jgi:HlyD family secretion protein
MAEQKASLNDLRIERKESRGSGSAGRILAAILLVAAAAAAVWYLGRGRALPVRTVAAREAAGLSADRTILNASGYVTARREATVSSKVTGKVVEVLVEEGMKVKDGQVLARLDDTNLTASLRLAQAQAQSAKAGLEETRVRIHEAELNLKRIGELARNSISARADLEHAEAEAASLKARLEQQQADIVVAERQVAAWQQQIDDTVIRAPFGGIVTSKNAQPGEMISPVSAGGGFTRTGICTIVDMDSLEVEVDVNEGYINRVQAAQPVEAVLDAYPEWKIPCKVIAIIPTADRQKSTVRVRVAFDKLDQRILPQMSVKVGFRETGQESQSFRRGVVIPRAAVHQLDDHDIVMVLQNGRAERRAVTALPTIGEDTLISAGIATGEKVIIDWPQGLSDGAAVKEIKP